VPGLLLITLLHIINIQSHLLRAVASPTQPGEGGEKIFNLGQIFIIFSQF